MMDEKSKTIRDLTPEAVALARRIVSDAKFGALAVLDPASGAPHVTRVAVATDGSGNPLILVSSLSRHTKALVKDPRCCLLLGEPGKGDPLAHPRVSLTCLAKRIGAEDVERPGFELRYLAHLPKAKLYAGFMDFSFFVLEVRFVALNGGFGRAYEMTGADFL